MVDTCSILARYSFADEAGAFRVPETSTIESDAISTHYVDFRLFNTMVDSRIVLCTGRRELALNIDFSGEDN